MKLTARPLQKVGHGIACNVGHEAPHGVGAGAHSNALSIDKERLTAGHVQPVEPCLSLDQKYPDLSIGNDLPMRAGGEVDLF